MNELLLTVGLPKSGKTTWARENHSPVVSPDAIRLALHGQRFANLAEPFVWAIARVMVRALFLAGHHRVIVDATNNTRKRRDAWKDDAWRRTYKVFDTSAEECMRRAQREGDTEILPVIKRMAEAHEPIGPEEVE